MVNGNKKGGAFERAIAVEMSEWWSLGQADDLFWRTPGSGARATTRTKKGKRTASGSGDLMATDDRGRYLMELCSFELKKGYQATTIQDLFDIPGQRPGLSQMDKFLAAAHRACQESGTRIWALIVQRNRRLPLITFPLAGIGQDLFHDNRVPVMITRNRTTPVLAPLLITSSWPDFICSISPNAFIEEVEMRRHLSRPAKKRKPS
jgi:hypothetical protein